MTKPTLKLDWCSHEAAKYACEKWHYSGTLSKFKNVYLGVWEDGRFIGVIVFGIGGGQATNGKRYGLAVAREMAELTRVALAVHETPVSRVVAVALRLLKKQSPGIRLVISLADLGQGHHGGIYQAGGWIYTGLTSPDVEILYGGKWVHPRTVTCQRSRVGLPTRPASRKHRYLMPLDAEMRARVLPLARPYPKRATGVDSDTAATHAAKGGASPTVALSRPRTA